MGCIRDVMDPEQNLIDFNQVQYHTGPEFGVCKTEKAADPLDSEDGTGKKGLNLLKNPLPHRSEKVRESVL